MQESLHRAGVLAQSAEICAAFTSAERQTSKMAQSATQLAGMKHKEVIEIPERTPTSSSESESESESTWSESEEEPSILCRFCFSRVEHNSNQPLECGSCGMQFHFNCYNAHLPCGHIHLPIEAEEVQYLRYSPQGVGVRRAEGNENSWTRRLRIDL